MKPGSQVHCLEGDLCVHTVNAEEARLPSALLEEGAWVQLNPGVLISLCVVFGVVLLPQFP